MNARSRNLNIGVTVAALLLSAFSAQAALVSVDWRTNGDGLITRDFTTSLEWLDLSQTDNQSYSAVQGRLTSDLAGWRVASAEEAEALFVNLGLPIEDSFGPNPAAAIAVRKMVQLFGNTFADFFSNPGSGRAIGVYGFVDFSIFNGFHLQKGAFIDETGVFSSPNYTGQPGDVNLYTANRDGHANDNIQFRHMGTFLVRAASDIPEPFSLALVAAAILGLFTTRCSKARN